MKLRVALLCCALVASVGVFASEGHGAWCGNTRCQASANWFPSGTYSGVLSEIRANSLTWVSGFIVGTLWVVPSPQGQVEEGIGRDGVQGIHWYWAEVSTCGNSIEFFGAALNTSYSAKISHNRNGMWAVYRNGVHLANSKACYDNVLDNASTGIESTGQSNTGNGTAINLQKRTTIGQWTYNWGGATIDEEPGVSAAWMPGQEFADLTWSQP